MGDSILIRSSSKLSPLRLINSVVVLSRIAARYGVGVETLLEGSGIKPDDLYDSEKRITLRQEMTVTRRMKNLLHHVPWIGLEVGQEYHFSANGKLGLAMMCCENLMEALRLSLTYIHLTNSYHQYTMTVRDGLGLGEFRELVDLGDIRIAVCEAEVASLQCMAMLGSDVAVIFKEIRFAYPEPSYAEKYHDLFKCDVSFNAPSHTLVFDTDYLKRPLKQANPLVRQAMEEECRRMLPLLQNHDSLADRIRQELSSQKDFFPKLDQIARKISFSPRTLRRRLEEEGTSYKTIVSDVRKQRALDLLKSTNHSMEKVAAILGFSEVSSFYRAFKGWTGETPSHFRE